MKQVQAIIERVADGTYSVYMDADMDYLITGTGKTAEEAIQCFKDGYRTPSVSMQRKDLSLNRSSLPTSTTWHRFSLTSPRHSLLRVCQG